MRRRISKKQVSKPDRPWKAPLDPAEFGEVQWPDEMEQTAAEETAAEETAAEHEMGPIAAEETAAEEAATEQEPVNLLSDEEVEMHTRGAAST